MAAIIIIIIIIIIITVQGIYQVSRVLQCCSYPVFTIYRTCNAISHIECFAL